MKVSVNRAAYGKGDKPLFRGRRESNCRTHTREKGDKPLFRRRGVLLLVILGLLAMFGLVAVAFVVVAGNALRTAQIHHRIGQYDLRPEEIAHEAFMQLATGSNNSMSVIGPHSLLEDMYSNATFTGQITDVGPVAGGQLIEFTLPDPTRHLGSVLTMLSGQAAGQSTHIVGVGPQTGIPQMLAFERGIPSPGDRFIINGTPFSGTGFGYYANSPLLNAWDPLFPPSDPANLATWESGGQYALLPNPAAFRPNSAIGYLDPAGPGGANEGHDVPDYQNMLLAAQIETGNGLVTIPSLHRPALVRYWMARMGIDPPDFMQPLDNTVVPIDLQRKIILRPLPEDHRRFNGLGFNGSNPRFHPAWDGVFVDQYDANGDPNPDGVCDYAWDVDNDGDGQEDGIWVDLGLPVRSTPDGRLFKPLISFLCLDLDGRLNVNAHGCLAQADETDRNVDGIPDYYDVADAGFFTQLFGSDYQFAGLTPTARLPRGQGYGPPEINLGPLFGDVAADSAARGFYQDLLTSRYGAWEAPAAVPGRPAEDPLSWNKWYEYGGTNYWTFDANVIGAYGSPPNPQGDGAIGLDAAGRPLYIDAGIDEQFNDPYESDLSRRSARGALSSLQIDSPFSVAELERLLRPFDADATRLPSRLWNVGQSVLHEHRRKLTTESNDVPCPNVAITMELLLEGGPQNNPGYQWLVANAPGLLPVRHVSDLMVLLLIKHGAPPNSAREMLPHLLPRELLAGLRMDLNRPVGDGQDNNNDGVVDEPGRVLPPSQGEPAASLDPNFPGEILLDAFRQVGSDGFPVDADGDGTPDVIPFDHARGADVNGDRSNAYDVDRALARQLKARHLFVLLMLLRDVGHVDPTPGENTLTPDQRKELTVRRLAQWAVNAVDFHDADAIMTPFEYDLEPFTDEDGDENPWDVDGIISVNTADPDNNRQSPRPSADDTEPYRGLVWGCERPELLLNETLGLHDRRVADTTGENNGDGDKRTDSNGQEPPAPADDDLDQPRIPQGSAFFELLCPRSATCAAAPRELYRFDPASRQWYLDLGRWAPPDPEDPTGLPYPVWRMVITKSHPRNVLNENNVRRRLQRRPHSSSLEPEQFADARADTGDFSLLPNPSPEETNNVDIERIVWFTTQPPGGQIDEERIYYNRGGGRYLVAGSYAVVGPRRRTTIGAKTFTAIGDIGEPSPHEIVLNPVGVIDNDGTNNYPGVPAEIKPAGGIVVAAEPPAGWTNTGRTAPNGIGISISEPLPFENYYPEPDSRKGGAGLWEWYGDPDQLGQGGFRDAPLDTENGRPLAGDRDNIRQTGTYQNYKTVLLQRLANPLQPYDPLANPYRTVDWLPIDLTVFNGEDTQPAEWPPAWATDHRPPVDPGPWDPDDPNPDTNPAVALETRQRGGNPADYGEYNLWAQVSLDLTETDPSGPADNNFRHNLSRNTGHTLGYINETFQENPPVAPRQVGWLTSMDFNPPGQSPYIGDPVRPFPWLTWNNRPYVSQLELLLVPSSYPGRLLTEYRLASATPRPYDPNSPDDVSFPHLVNFFHSDAPGNSSQLHRLLEFIHVPSRFVGAETQGNPIVFADPTFGDHNFRPPFNWISRYRDPGRVNINTVFSREVWRGLTNYFPTMNPSAPLWRWISMFNSRRGYNGSFVSIDPRYPTRFANPFRSAFGAHLVPIDALKSNIEREINATLLRTWVHKDEPLFSFARRNPPDSGHISEINDSDRSPYFRYQGLQRLGNLVTTRSNVYAIWITVGYFEVHPVEVGPVHPDGYALGQELGMETGDIERHRAFYVFDRSIPVGFQRGKDHNVEKAILLKRFIE